MNTAEHLQLDDIRGVLCSPAISQQQAIDICQNELGVTVNPELNREEMALAMFEAYNIAMKEAEQNKFKQTFIRAPKQLTSSSAVPAQKSKKEFITELVSAGIHTREGIMKIMVETYDYGVTNKSPRTRVSKVLRELKKAGRLLDAADGILKLR